MSKPHRIDRPQLRESRVVFFRLCGYWILLLCAAFDAWAVGAAAGSDLRFATGLTDAAGTTLDEGRGGQLHWPVWDSLFLFFFHGKSTVLIWDMRESR